MITLIVGKVAYLQEWALDRIRKQQGSSVPQSFYGPECEAKAIIEALTNGSLFDAAPFIMLRAADRLAKKQQDLLRPQFQNVPKEVSFVILAEQVDRRTKFWQELIKNAKVISADAPSPQQRRSWLQEECQRRGLRFSRDAFQRLVEEGMADFNQALLLLDKLELYLNDQKSVDLETIEICLSGSLAAKVFDWADAMVAGEWPRALGLLQSLWSTGEAPLALLAILIRHFRILLRAIENRSLWTRRSECARVLGVPPFTVDRYLQQARSYQRHQVLALWQDLQAADRRLKSSPLPKEWELEALLWDLRRKRADAAVKA